MKKYEKLRTEARCYYDHLLPEYKTDQKFKHPIELALDEYDKMQPGKNVYQLKAAQYKVLAEKISLKIFDYAPFYFATDLLPGDMDGRKDKTAGGWLFRRNEHLFADANPDAYKTFKTQMAHKLHLCCGPYIDTLHYCYPINNVLKHGFRKLYEKALQQLGFCSTDEERDFLICAIEGLLAAKRIAARFAETAAERIKHLDEPEAIRNMHMIVDAASKTPWEKPEHFHEGLNTLWFCRDICGPLDGIGNSHLGRPDKDLYDLYRHDIDSGYLTQDEAFDLVCRFILLGDCHYDKDSTASGYSDHELEMGYVLGGCDSLGNEIFNEVTSMFVRAHRELKAIYPKVHYRFCANSSKGYLHEIGADYLQGRSIAGMSNDDSIIPALVKSGKTLEDARGYINHGCWGVVIEGMESMSGGNYHHLLTMLDLSIHEDQAIKDQLGIRIDSIVDSDSFDEVYQRYLGNVLRMTKQRADWIRTYGRLGTAVNPIPLFSACMTGCLENRKDYFAGGARYNNSEIDISEFANAVDGLLAIKHICFTNKLCSLTEYIDAVRDNWANQECLRQSVLNGPHYGDESDESVNLSRKLLHDIYEGTRGLVSERGGSYCMNAYVYREFRLMAEHMRATPDGRRDGDLFAMGICPTRYHYDSLPALVGSVAGLDAVEICVNHSVNIQLSVDQLDANQMESLLRVFAACGLKHIQINCINLDLLRAAQEHPEEYQDIVVRVCGFSAKFVSLSREWQDEFIQRCIHQSA